MKKNSVSLLVFVAMSVAVVLLVLPEPANAVCCHSNSKRRCGDCGKTSSHCGLKDCNLFGCNCDADDNGDICRFGSCFVPPENNKRPKVTGKDVLLRGDFNKDGALTLEEAKRLLDRSSYRNKRSASDAVAALDTNNDGVLSAEEIDN